jgi:hypothetical protein
VLSSRRRLHQEVRDTILACLLDRLQRPKVAEMSARAASRTRAAARATAASTRNFPTSYGRRT